jgi:hypothetical protein
VDPGTSRDATLGEDKCPFEDKASDWGWYDGRRVALDYSDAQKHLRDCADR